MKSALPERGIQQRGIGASAWCLCLAGVMVAACGAPSAGPSTTATDASTAFAAAGSGEEQAVDTVARVLRPLPYRVEAWPRVAEGDPDRIRLVEQASLAFASVPEAGFPWTVVLELTQGPRELGAIALRHDGDPRQIADFGLMILSGPLDLGRETFPRLLEAAQRAGEGVVGREPGWYVFELPTPVSANFVVLRARSNQGGVGTGLGPLVLLSPSDTADFVQRNAGAVLQRLSPSPDRSELAEWWPGQMPVPASQEGSTASPLLNLPEPHTDAFGPTP